MKSQYFIPLLIAAILASCVDNKRKTYPVDGFAVAGQITYEKSTPTASRFGIRKSTEESPVAGALVQVIDTSDNNKVIVESSTDDDGVFNIGLPLDLQSSPLAVRVLTVSAVDNFPMAVFNQDTPAKTYHAVSDIFVGTTNDMKITIKDGVFNSSQAGAFNVFAQVMRGYKFMATAGGEADTKFPKLNVLWESNEVGIDCTCFFKRFLEAATINLRNDEDDDSVILHELGHYLHFSFSATSSPGGTHILSCDQNDDPRLTWSEGWATGFSLIVRRDSYYIDTDPRGSFSVEHEFPCHQGQGATSETLVAAVYLDLYDGTTNDMPTRDGDTISITFLQIWNAMKGVRGSRLTFHDYFNVLTASGAVTKQQWADNFSSLGMTESNLITNSSPSSSPTTSPHVLPQAAAEFSATVE